ncbi:MAG TPA: amidase [Dehalococcoidia bacterium]|nr:amidase [Dehalococcoidia bacterium]
MSEPYELSVAEAARLIGRKRLSSEELVASLLVRIARLEPKVRAWQVVDESGIRDAAARATRALEAELRGVPFGIKDIIDVAGLPTSAGFKPLMDQPVEADATVVTRLREAGALILGKTVTTQFAHADPPVTRNPWNLERTPGGSSSGSAAAVAARMVPAALGSQTGGSVLRPASYCGLVGLKPTFGRISRAGVVPLAWSLDHVGIMARTVADVGIVLQVTAGFDKLDPGSANRQARDFLRAVERAIVDKPKAPRLGYFPDLLEQAEPAVRDHVAEVANRLRGAGAQIHHLPFPDSYANVLAAHRLIMQPEMTAVHRQNLAQHPEHYARRIRASVEVGQLLPAAAYVHALRLRRRYQDAFRLLLRGLDGFLMPTVTNVAPDPRTTGDPSFQSIWSLTGFPSITLPTGLSPEGLPIGTQLIAHPFQESALIEAGRWVETEIGFVGPPPIG